MDRFSDPQLDANSEVVLITGHTSLETSIQALRLGAAGYIVKPINQRRLQGVLSRVTNPPALKAEVEELTARLPAAAPPAAALAPARTPAQPPPLVASGEKFTIAMGTSIAQAEKVLIPATFAHDGQHKERTACVLGISLKTLYNRLMGYQPEAPLPAPPP
jgi:DNA-binding NtrC family response regulator